MLWWSRSPYRAGGWFASFGLHWQGLERYFRYRAQRENFSPFLQWTSHFFFLFHKLSCPFYNFISSLVTAERKTSLGKDWHGSCLRCENCNKTLLPGSHSEHDGKPYCNHPCYSALFGPGGKFCPRTSTISPVVMSTKWDRPVWSCL